MTFSCLIRACASMGAIEMGKCIHDKIVLMGLLPKNIILGNALLDMYLKCGQLVKAQQVFDQLPAHDVVSWTTLITGYCLHGLGKRALEFFKSMQDEGLSPNPVTMLCILRVCSTVGDLKGGISIHSEIIRKDHLKNFSMLGNALIDMYAKCGAPTKALEVFSGIQDRDKVTWTTLITAYCQQAYVEEALKCFECMQDEGLSPDAVMFACVLQACGTVSAIQRGESLHAEIIRRGLLASDIVLGTALVDFYAKCIALTKAHKIFEDLVGRTVVTWNTLIGRYSEVGMYNMVFELLNQMIRAGVEPDLITFVIVLNACSYVGLVDKGEMYWEMMSEKYGLNMNLEHQIAIVNLHSHAGYFDKAKEIIDNMSSFDNIHMWLALLSACQKWGHLKLGRLSFENVVRLNRKCRAAYTCMVDIYCKAGMQTDADRVQSMSLDSGA
ncbi:hypothetical protein KP509_22G068300 [Ceratopteris richardii]|nr:hypothetical protein KP509_22G068300 [Ceratopteris richardii]